MPRLARAAVPIAALALAACRSRGGEPVSGGAARAPDPQTLALSHPGSTGPIDALVNDLQAAARRDASNAAAWVALGRGWVKKARTDADPGFYRNAESCAALALRAAPDDPSAMGLRTLVLLDAHRFDQARAAAEAILARRPDDVTALGVLSDALLELGRFEEAAAAAQRMVDLKPGLPSYTRASYLRWLQGDVAAARESIRLAIDAGDPRDPEPLAWTLVQGATLFWHEGDLDGADAGFERALRALPDYLPAIIGRARVALARGPSRQVVDLAARADARSRGVETAWLLGDARAAAGDAAGAREAYDLAVRRGRATDGLALAQFLATHDRDAAEAVRLAEAERRVRGGSYVDDALAWALYRAGHIGEARAASDRAIRLGTRDARLRYHAGAIRLAQGEADEGLALVRHALSLNPAFDPTGAAEAREIVARSHLTPPAPLP